MRPRQRLRFRAAPHAAICLAIGATANVLIAWVSAARLDPEFLSLTSVDLTNDAQFHEGELARLRSHPLAARYSDDQLLVGVEAVRGASRRVALIQPYWAASLTYSSDKPFRIAFINDVTTRVSAGWPLPSFTGERWMNGDSIEALKGDSPDIDDISDLYDHQGMWPVGLGGSRMRVGMNGRSSVLPRLLPLQPQWPGLAVNSILYAMTAWVLLFAPFAVRRALRRRRGLCERCAYPRGSSEVCSECGSPFSPHPARTRTP